MISLITFIKTTPTEVIPSPPIKPLNETLEILSKVNEFYDSSWSKLLYVIGGAFAVLAIAVPLIIQYIQNKTIKASEKELENKIIDEIEKAKKEIKDELTATLNEKIKEYDVKLKKSSDELSGMMMFINGVNYSGSKEFLLAYQCFVYSFESHLDGNIKSQFKLNLENILDSLKKLTSESIEILREQKFYNLESLINRMIKDADDEMIEIIMKIREKLKK